MIRAREAHVIGCTLSDEHQGFCILPTTDRGFARVDFTDANGDPCSIQDSSVATTAILWLGQNAGTHHMNKCLSRMHLTQEQVKRLLPLLHRFADTGSIQ